MPAPLDVVEKIPLSIANAVAHLMIADLLCEPGVIKRPCRSLASRPEQGLADRRCTLRLLAGLQEHAPRVSPGNATLAEEARNVVLSDEQIKRIVAASYELSVEFGLLVEVAAITGARYSQIAGLLVGDLQDGRDDCRLMMPSSLKGKGIKKVLRRPVPIPTSLAEKLRAFAGERSSSEPLLLKPRVEPPANSKKTIENSPAPSPWNKSDHYRLFKRAALEALREAEYEGEDPVTIYALRHSSIVRQILHGVPVRVVAVMHDTSIQMIEKNYSARLADFSDTLARAALLQIEAAPL